MTFLDEYGLVQYQERELARYSREGACEVCGISAADLTERYSTDGYRPAPASIRLNFDHCHAHGWIRGRLCTRCNTEMSLSVRMGLERSRRAPQYLAHLAKCPDCTEPALAA